MESGLRDWWGGIPQSSLVNQCFVEDSVTLYSPFIFVQLTDLCLDTVTLKKNTLYVDDVKKKKRKKKRLIKFSLHSCTCVLFQRVLFTCFVEFCAQCHMFLEILSPFLKRTQRY